MILRAGSASDAERHDPALAEIVGIRLLLVNVLRPMAAGEKLAPEAFDKMLDQISEVKHQLAAKLQQAARKKPQREENGGEGCTERGSCCRKEKGPTHRRASCSHSRFKSYAVF